MKATLVIVVIGGALHFGDVNSTAQTWTPVSPAISRCGPVASSADGTKLIAVPLTSDGVIYTSTNSGSSWMPQTNAPAVGWNCVASSAVGDKLAMVSGDNGAVYTSTDSGLSWTEQTNAPVAHGYSIASSADGATLVAAQLNPGAIYISTNSGVLWTLVTNLPAAFWRSVGLSAGGTKLVVGTWFGSPNWLYASTNLGISWVSNTIGGSVNGIASSADGTKFVAACDANIYTSSDSGNTWISNNVPHSTAWTAVASSADGTKLVATSFAGFIYASTNAGASWSITFANPPSAVFYGFSIASSADGNKLVAADTHAGAQNNPNGNIYTWQTTATPVMNIASVSNGLKLSWLVPSIDFVLQQNSDLSTTNWVTLPNMPTLNLTNLQDEVFLPLPAYNTFYRLSAP